VKCVLFFRLIADQQRKFSVSETLQLRKGNYNNVATKSAILLVKLASQSEFQCAIIHCIGNAIAEMERNTKCRTKSKVPVALAVLVSICMHYSLHE